MQMPSGLLCFGSCVLAGAAPDVSPITLSDGLAELMLG